MSGKKKKVSESKKRQVGTHASSSLTKSDFPKRLYSRNETAKILGLSCAGILAMWAQRKTPNLPYIRMGKLIRYLEEDILTFIAENRVSQK